MVTLPDKRILTAIAGYVCGGLFIVSLPIWVSAVIDDLGASERVGGNLGSLEIGCVALAMFVTSRRIHRANRRRLAISGGLCAIVANVLSAHADTVSTLCIARAAVGLGLGTVLVCALSTAAGTGRSQRTFAFMEASLAIAASLFYTVSARQVPAFGAGGVFMTIAVVHLACLPFLKSTPAETFSKQVAESSVPRVDLLTGCALIANGVFYCGMFSFWTFVSRIGLSLDIGHNAIGDILSGAFIASLISTLAVPVLAARFGYRALVIWTVPIMAVAGFSLTHASDLTQFAVAVIALKVHFLLYSTMINGMFALTDPSGRGNGYALAIAIIGSAIGPALGGQLLASAGYGALGWSACLVWGLCFPILFMLARKVDRRARKLAVDGVDVPATLRGST